jgi:hypothetical protein
MIVRVVWMSQTSKRGTTCVKGRDAEREGVAIREEPKGNAVGQKPG